MMPEYRTTQARGEGNIVNNTVVNVVKLVIMFVLLMLVVLCGLMVWVLVLTV